MFNGLLYICFSTQLVHGESWLEKMMVAVEAPLAVDIEPLQEYCDCWGLRTLQ